jgi:hypothetical protein
MPNAESVGENESKLNLWTMHVSLWEVERLIDVHSKQKMPWRFSPWLLTEQVGCQWSKQRMRVPVGFSFMHLIRPSLGTTVQIRALVYSLQRHLTLRLVAERVRSGFYYQHTFIERLPRYAQCDHPI